MKILNEILDELRRATVKFPTWPTDPLHAVSVLGRAVRDIHQREVAGAEAVIRYPKEEAVAAVLCGKHRLMYWWLENPRKASATMHARCAGQVEVVREVDL